MEDIKKVLQKINKQNQEVWKSQDIREMALNAIETLCIQVEDGMKAKEALDKIYRFAHCACNHTCKDVHEDWRKELIEFYRKEYISKSGK